MWKFLTEDLLRSVRKKRWITISIWVGTAQQESFILIYIVFKHFS
jgi:hypothetical protein